MPKHTMSGGADEQHERPLIEWILAAYPDTPKTRAKQWIVAGRVSVDGRIVRKPQQVMPDPASGLKLLDRRSTALDCGSGWEIHPRLSLLYLDCALAIVNKGAGLVSVPAPNTELSALSILQDILTGRLRPRDHRAPGKSLPPAFRRFTLLPVHRIDQYTSGVLCLACNPTARQNLIDQLKAHTMQREYIAFVEGRPPMPHGTWSHLLSLSPDELRQQVVTEPAVPGSASKTQEAVTHYEVLEEYSFLGGNGVVSKLKLRLETGLRHQIRIQAAEVGLPLVGERKYHHGPPATRLVEFPRQALHAASLTLNHPEQPERRLTWQASFPKDLRQLEHTLRQGRARSENRNKSYSSEA